MIDLKGKVAVVFGLANKRSIAWGIAQKLSEAGATLAICYQNERLKREADALIPELKDAKAYQCDVSVDAEIDSLFAALKETARLRRPCRLRTGAVRAPEAPLPKARGKFEAVGEQQADQQRATGSEQRDQQHRCFGRQIDPQQGIGRGRGAVGPGLAPGLGTEAGRLDAALRGGGGGE